MARAKRCGFVAVPRAKVFEPFHKLEIKACIFSNLPQRDKGGSGSQRLAECRPLKSHLVAQIEYASRTDVNHLRQSKFVVLHDDKPANGVTRETLVG
jgi:hypothetical protein